MSDRYSRQAIRINLKTSTFRCVSRLQQGQEKATKKFSFHFDRLVNRIKEVKTESCLKISGEMLFYWQTVEKESMSH